MIFELFCAQSGIVDGDQTGSGLPVMMRSVLESAAWLVAAVGGTIAAFQAIAEMKKNTAERVEGRLTQERDLRWRQAELAKKAIDEVMANPLACSALKMLDWSGLTYAIPTGGLTKAITTEVVAGALRTSDTTFSDLDEPFIRDCFDALFDGFERIEHYLRIDLLKWEDVRAPFAYHVKKLGRLHPTLERFLAAYEFSLASAFIARFATDNAARELSPATSR